MRLARQVVGLTVALAGLQVLAGCGGVQGSSSSAPVSYNVLNGNWNIVGNGSPLSDPSISFSLVVAGSELYGQGSVQVGCGNPPLVGGGGGITLTGSIADNGSFQLTEPAGTGLSLGGSYIQVVVTGSVPSAGSTSWSGTYSITNAAGTTGCITDETGSFTASAYVPFSANYSGPLFAGNTGAGGVNITLAASQGSPMAAQSLLLGTSYYLPLTATATVSGIPCFAQGSTVSNTSNLAPNQIDGSQVNMRFTMNDGSVLYLLGTLTDTQETSLTLDFLSVTGGQCNGNYNGTLVRQ